MHTNMAPEHRHSQVSEFHKAPWAWAQTRPRTLKTRRVQKISLKRGQNKFGAGDFLLGNISTWKKQEKYHFCWATTSLFLGVKLMEINSNGCFLGSWWLNQPHLKKLWSSNWIVLPQVLAWKLKENLKPPPGFFWETYVLTNKNGSNMQKPNGTGSLEV